MPLFDHRFVYQCDRIGPYIDLEGTVIEVGEGLSDSWPVKVQTDRGVFEGWDDHGPPPQVGYRATIRIYDAGGGWYPDNRIMSWSSHAPVAQVE